MKRIDLYSLTQPALIIPCSTRILYLQQCGGTACMQREMEGVLVPIDYDYLSENYTESLEYHLTSLFPGGNAGIISQKTAELIQKMLDASLFTRGIDIDHSRLVESVESWLYVKVSGDLDGTLHGFGETDAVLIRFALGHLPYFQSQTCKEPSLTLRSSSLHCVPLGPR